MHKNNLIRQIIASGQEIPKIKVAECLTLDVALLIERELIAAIGRHPAGPLLNISEGGEAPARSLKGRKQSPEHIAARAAALRGRAPSQQCIEAARATNTGRIHTEAARLAMSRYRRGRPHSVEWVRRQGAACSVTRKGKKLSTETKLKMSTVMKLRWATVWKDRRAKHTT